MYCTDSEQRSRGGGKGTERNPRHTTWLHHPAQSGMSVYHQIIQNNEGLAQGVLKMVLTPVGLLQEVPENKHRVTLKGIVIARRNSGISTTFRLRRLLLGLALNLFSPCTRRT